MIVSLMEFRFPESIACSITPATPHDLIVCEHGKKLNLASMKFILQNFVNFLRQDFVCCWLTFWQASLNLSYKTLLFKHAAETPALFSR